MSKSERLSEIVERVAEKYPAVQLTSGYIGNVGNLIFNGEPYDDRSWYVFTKVYDFKSNGKYKYGGYSTEDLELLVEWAENNLETWVKNICLTRCLEQPKAKTEVKRPQYYGY